MSRWAFTRRLIPLSEADARLGDLRILASPFWFIAGQGVRHVKIGRLVMYEETDIDDLVKRLRGFGEVAYTARVHREDHWWMIEVDGVDGLTQARTIDEIELSAREFVAVNLRLPLDEVRVSVVHKRSS